MPVEVIFSLSAISSVQENSILYHPLQTCIRINSFITTEHRIFEGRAKLH